MLCAYLLNKPLNCQGFPAGASGKEPTCPWRRSETWVSSLGAEDPLEGSMATHSSILAWRIPWTEEPGGLHGVAKSWTRLKWLSMHAISWEVLIWIDMILTWLLHWVLVFQMAREQLQPVSFLLLCCVVFCLELSRSVLALDLSQGACSSFH